VPNLRHTSDHAAALKECEDLLQRIAKGKMPSVDPEAIDPAAIGAPTEWHAMIRYLRTAPFVGFKGCVGAGIGLREIKGEETDEQCIVVLVHKKLPTSKLTRSQTIPQEVKHDGAQIRIDVQEAGFDPIPEFMASPATGNYPRATGSCSGSALSENGNPNPCAGGTLTGLFDGRAVTAAHVALGFGFAEFLGSLPASLLWLFDSPDGNEVLASANVQRGQGLHRLFEVDTNWPILVPMPTPLIGAGVMGFLFVDGAAGDANPIPIQPFPVLQFPLPRQPFSFARPAPPLAADRARRFGGRIRSGRIAIPGEGCFKDGQTSGLTNGRVWMPFFQLYIPLPLGLVNSFVFFDLVLCRLVIGPGDSGSAVLADDLHYLAQVSLGLPFPAASTPVAGDFSCPVRGSDLMRITIGTPHYLHELLLNVNF